MVPWKTWVSENFWPNLEISEEFFGCSRSSLSGDFESRSLEF